MINNNVATRAQTRRIIASSPFLVLALALPYLAQTEEVKLITSEEAGEAPFFDLPLIMIIMCTREEEL